MQRWGETAQFSETSQLFYYIYYNIVSWVYPINKDYKNLILMY